MLNDEIVPIDEFFIYSTRAKIEGGAFGLCLGGIGVGKCGKTTGSQSVNITNTAIAKAFYENAFSCKSTVDGGNSVVAGGGCECRGLFPKQCAEVKAAYLAQQSKACSELADDLTQEEKLCLCKVGSGGCNINISQSSLFTSQAICKQSTEVQTKLKDGFSTKLLSELKQTMSDIGGLFDSADSKSVIKLANDIQQSITDQMIQDISTQVTAKNEVVSECGGINIGITQAVQFQVILSVMLQNKTIADAQGRIVDQVKASLDRKDNGVLGFLQTWYGILITCLIIAGVLIAIIIIVRNRRAASGSREQGIEMTSLSK